jgi:hypothetical protein
MILSAFGMNDGAFYDFPRPYFHWSFVAPHWVREGRRRPR